MERSAEVRSLLVNSKKIPTTALVGTQHGGCIYVISEELDSFNPVFFMQSGNRNWQQNGRVVPGTCRSLPLSWRLLVDSQVRLLLNKTASDSSYIQCLVEFLLCSTYEDRHQKWGVSQIFSPLELLFSWIDGCSFMNSCDHLLVILVMLLFLIWFSGASLQLESAKPGKLN